MVAGVGLDGNHIQNRDYGSGTLRGVLSAAFRSNGLEKSD